MVMRSHICHLVLCTLLFLLSLFNLVSGLYSNHSVVSVDMFLNEIAFRGHSSFRILVAMYLFGALTFWFIIVIIKQSISNSLRRNIRVRPRDK